jgi:hypothetical protein
MYFIGLTLCSFTGGEIGGKEPLEIAILPFRERAAMLNSCIVDEDIELAMPVDDIGDGSRAGLGSGEAECGAPRM